MKMKIGKILKYVFDCVLSCISWFKLIRMFMNVNGEETGTRGVLFTLQLVWIGSNGQPKIQANMSRLKVRTGWSCWYTTCTI